MKFILEKLDIKFITRKVIEEEQRTGRFVTEVLLSPPEWYDFRYEVFNTMRYTYYDQIGQTDSMQVHIRRPFNAVVMSSPIAYDLTQTAVTIRLDKATK